MRARLAPRAASFYRKETGLLLAVGGLVWGHGQGGEGGAVTVLGYQWAWVPRASPEPTTLLRGCRASPLETSLTSMELSESNA